MYSNSSDFAACDFGVANAANMNMKSCGGGGRTNKQIHGCSNFGHHRGHHMMKHAYHLK